MFTVRAPICKPPPSDKWPCFPPAEGKPGHENPYATQHFHYDPADHTLTCPRGETLDHEGHTTREGVRVDRYRCHCRDCPVQKQCTRDPKGRQVEVWPHTAEVQRMRARLKEAGLRSQWQRRREMIERRFGQIKQHDGFRRWTMWGLENARTQWSVLCATLNLRILWRRWQAGQKAPARRRRPCGPLGRDPASRP